MIIFREWELGLFSSFCFTIACERVYTIFIKQKQKNYQTNENIQLSVLLKGWKAKSDLTAMMVV